MSQKTRLIVVGNGMAGARAVEEILQRGGAEIFDITMFGAEPHGNYNRISLSNVLAGVEDPGEIFLNPLDWYEENAITLHAGVRITRLDRFAREVTTDDGTVHSYDKLIIATGSRPFFPPIPGMLDDAGRPPPGVFGFRNIADTEQMLEWAPGATRAAVIGGGLLGLEAARGLLERGLEVPVVHRAERLMNMQLDGQAPARSCAAASRIWGFTSISRRGPPSSSSAGTAGSPACASTTTRPSSSATWWSSRQGSVRRSSSRRAPG